MIIAISGNYSSGRTTICDTIIPKLNEKFNKVFKKGRLSEVLIKSVEVKFPEYINTEQWYSAGLEYRKEFIEPLQKTRQEIIDTERELLTLRDFDYWVKTINLTEDTVVQDLSFSNELQHIKTKYNAKTIKVVRIHLNTLYRIFGSSKVVVTKEFRGDKVICTDENGNEEIVEPKNLIEENLEYNPYESDLLFDLYSFDYVVYNTSLEHLNTQLDEIINKLSE